MCERGKGWGGGKTDIKELIHEIVEPGKFEMRRHASRLETPVRIFILQS